MQPEKMMRQSESIQRYCRLLRMRSRRHITTLGGWVALSAIARLVIAERQHPMIALPYARSGRGEAS
jgi:hypothetical protein